MPLSARAQDGSDGSEARERLTLPPVLREFSAIMLVLAALSAAYCAFMRFVLHRGYPYDWPFFTPVDRFGDFTIFIHKFEFFHSSTFFSTGFPINYPAAMAVLYEIFFYFFGANALRAFLVVLCLCFIVPAVLFARSLTRRGLSVAAACVVGGCAMLLSWPVLLLFDRANVEVFVWLSLAIAVWAYATRREWTAAAMFGMAAALKLFPFMYLALFLTRRKFPKVLFGAAVFVVVNVISLAILGPSIGEANHGINAGINAFRNNYMAHYLPIEGGLDHSILAFLKVIVAWGWRHHSDPALLTLTKIYIPLMAVGGTLLYFLRIRKLPWLNQLFCLSIASIYFTPYSGDGTLVHLYYGFALCSLVAVDAWRRKLEVPGLRTVFVCLALLLSVESFLLFNDRRYVGQFKCIVMGVLLVCLLRRPLSAPLDSDREERLDQPDASRIEGAHALPDAT